MCWIKGSHTWVCTRTNGMAVTPYTAGAISGIVDLGWGSGLCTSNKCSGDAIAADQESNFENDCVHLSSFLKEHLV